MIILIDNYDSFTWNLYHFLGDLGAETVVHRNDKISVGQVISARPQAIVLSPGPVHAQRGRHLPRTHREGVRTNSHPRRLPRPSGDRPGFRRQGDPRPQAHAWQAVRRIRHEGEGHVRAMCRTISRRRAIIR